MIDIDYDNELLSFNSDSIIKDKSVVLDNINRNQKLPIKSCIHSMNYISLGEYEKEINFNLKDLKKKVITFGVFDLMHIGHINLINKLTYYGEYIIVAVHNDEAVKRTKCTPINSETIRLESIKSLKNVDEVILYNDVFETIKMCDIDVFVTGEDQINSSFQKAIDYCKKHDIEHIISNRTPNISSTKLKYLN